MSLPDQILQSVFHHQGQTRRCLSEDWLTLFEAEGFTAAIFDCDGTLVDSKQAHLMAMQSAAQEQGQVMAPNWYATRTGLDRQTLFNEFQKMVTCSFDVERAIATSIDRFDGFTELIKPMPATGQSRCFLKGSISQCLSLALEHVAAAAAAVEMS